MDDKRKLIKFIKLKDKIIKGVINVNYINRKDIVGIRHWDSNKCKQIYKKLIYFIEKGVINGVGIYTCIWCIAHDNFIDINCKVCEYGKHHGICNEANSTYSKYHKEKVKKALTSKVYKEIIAKIEK